MVRLQGRRGQQVAPETGLLLALCTPIDQESPMASWFPILGMCQEHPFVAG